MVVVANRLPYSRGADGRLTVSPGGLVAALLPAIAGRDALWIGAHGSAIEESIDRDGVRLVSVATNATEQAAFYDGFSNGTLWPLYHDAVRPPSYDASWWSAYLLVNQRFAETTAQRAPPGALVWVHDYQLQLVPAMLRSLRPDVRIGYFHHIPFPHADLFRQLPWRCEIIAGIAGADVVGFQRRGDVTNFLTAASALCGLGVAESGDGSGQLTDGDRSVTVAAYPVPVDATTFANRARRASVAERARELRRALGSPQHLLLGIDRLDYTKGIDQRLSVIRSLFERGVLKPGRDVYLQVAVPSRGDTTGYAELRSEVERRVGDINGEFARVGSAVVHYLHRSVAANELSALYCAADIMLVTPFRDGMNLVAKEFVASRVDGGGQLVLSEFTGAADELPDAFLVNPHDTRSMEAAIEDALSAPDGGRDSMAAMRSGIVGQSPQQWASAFFHGLRRRS
jgi:trehalose 6-phosphate synthase